MLLALLLIIVLVTGKFSLTRKSVLLGAKARWAAIGIIVAQLIVSVIFQGDLIWVSYVLGVLMIFLVPIGIARIYGNDFDKLTPEQQAKMHKSFKLSR